MNRFVIQRTCHEPNQIVLQGTRIDGIPFTVNIIRSNVPMTTSPISIYYGHLYYNISVTFNHENYYIPNHIFSWVHIAYQNTSFPSEHYDIPPIVFSCISGLVMN